MDQDLVSYFISEVPNRRYSGDIEVSLKNL